MSDEHHLSRRDLIGRVTRSLIVTAIATPVGGAFETVFALTAHVDPVNAVAGVDRVVMKQGRTWLNAWAGYGTPPRAGRGGRGGVVVPTGPAPRTAWSMVSGPGTVTFADPNAAATSATFSTTGDYVLRVSADNGETTASSTLTVRVELPPPTKQLSPVVTTRHTITSPLWRARTKTLITSWIPHCIDQCTRPDIPAGRGDGGLDNFIEAAKALRGEPHAAHRGPRSTRGSRRSWPPNIPTDTCRPPLPCATHRARAAPEFPVDRHSRGPNDGVHRHARITKGTWPATSLNRRSTTTR